jgi:tRNA modification GTPase
MRNLENTIAAIATAQGEGGIAIVRVSGAGAKGALDAVFKRARSGQKGADWTPNRLYYGHIVEKGQTVDEAMAVWMRAPYSYTREDVCEIHCHGGRYAAQKALSLLIENGAQPARPGEFTLRAFLNGRIDLSQAEAVMSMISANSQSAARAAARQMEGGLARFVSEISGRLTDMLSLIEAGVDFPDEIDEEATSSALQGGIRVMIAQIKEACDERAARVVREGLAVAIAGLPNAGKSSLMNALTQSDRAIVTNVPGTTRDILTERLRFRGLDMTLFDTAGLRETRDEIERQGVERARRAMDSADVVLLVVDASIDAPAAEKALISGADARFLVVLNKSDLGIFPGRQGLFVSAKTGHGIPALLEALYNRAGRFDQAEGRLTQPRHIDCAKRAIDALQRALSGLCQGAPADVCAVDLMEALEALMEITGKNASDEVIDAVFRNFCVGK